MFQELAEEQRSVIPERVEELVCDVTNRSPSPVDSLASQVSFVECRLLHLYPLFLKITPPPLEAHRYLSQPLLPFYFFTSLLYFP
jgi:hypothetical protein